MEFSTFSEFVTTPPLKGLGGSLDLIERIIKDDPETLALYRAVTVGKPHKHTGRSADADIVSISKPDAGNSKAYTLARLKRDHSHLFDAVVAGNMSANAAAIEAGFRKKPTALETLQRAWAKQRQRDGGKAGGETAGRGRPKGDRVREILPEPCADENRPREQAGALLGVSGRLVYLDPPYWKQAELNQHNVLIDGWHRWTAHKLPRRLSRQVESVTTCDPGSTGNFTSGHPLTRPGGKGTLCEL